MRPFMRPFLVALCECDKLFGPIAYPLIDFFNAASSEVDEDDFMAELDQFAPAFGAVLVRLMDSPVEDLQRATLRMVTNVTRLQDPQILRTISTKPPSCPKCLPSSRARTRL